MALVERKPGDAASKLYLSGIEIGKEQPYCLKNLPPNCTLVELKWAMHNVFKGWDLSPNCTLVELKYHTEASDRTILASKLYLSGIEMMALAC